MLDNLKTSDWIAAGLRGLSAGATIYLSGKAWAVAAAIRRTRQPQERRQPAAPSGTWIFCQMDAMPITQANRRHHQPRLWRKLSFKQPLGWGETSWLRSTRQ